MAVFISMLRGVNLGGHHKVKMDELRAIYESLGFMHPKTYIQSGNVVFQTHVRDRVAIANRIENEIERTFGFRSAVIIRTAKELGEVVTKNPFASRGDINPSKLLVTFLASDPGDQARNTVSRLEVHPEEMRVQQRELYVFYPEGMGRSKLPVKAIDKILNTPGTARNWNTVLQLLQIAEGFETNK